MTGLILNTADEWLPPSSPWRTRLEERHHPPLFHTDDGTLVYEVWFFAREFGRWFVMTRGYDWRLATQGVVFFDSIEQLRAVLRQLRSTRG